MRYASGKPTKKARMKHLIIDGAAFSTPEGFYDEISRAVVPDAAWGRNLHALNDILRGGFETPKE